MDFRILGPVEVSEDERSLSLGGQKQRALLAVLLLHANKTVSTDRLIDALWEEDPPSTATKALQVYVSRLRKLLGGDRVQTKPAGYSLRVEEGELDLERFQRLREEGGLAEALSLWRGTPLSEFRYQRFAQAEIARLEEARLTCLEDRIEADLAAGRHGDLVGELEALVSEQPLRQRLRGQLMLALYRSGRDDEALEVYRSARRVLVEEVGLEPRRELRELQQLILNQDPALDLVAQVERGPESPQGVFVGRERELEQLRTGLDEALVGCGRLFLLVGEPGIGKSRLAEELVAEAKARGIRVLVGRCWEAGGAPAYWPWVQSLRACVRGTQIETLRAQLGPGASDLAQLLPELRELFEDLPEPPALESEGARFRLFEAASAFLTSAAQSRPLLLVLDDLHAADEPSLLLLQFLARELGESRLLVVGAYRNVDPAPADPLMTTMTELAREPVTRSLALVGLDEYDVRRFIELTSGESPSDEFVAAIHEETEGNPLFVGEIVRLLAAEGGFADEAPRLAIPQSVRDVIARRLRHLSDECNNLLLLASVLGREFALVALARVARVSEDDLLETLDEAMAAGVVLDVPGSPGQLGFAHVLIRDTLYEGMTTARRVRLHRLAIEALEALYGEEPGSHLAELAYHCSAGSDFDKALHYAQSAADLALGLLAYEEAARLYEAALDVLPLSALEGDATRCELLLSLGESEIRAGNTPVAKEAFLDAAKIARRLGLGRQLARAAAGYGGRIIWERAGRDELLVPLLEEGLAAVGEKDLELRVRLLARLAGALRDEPARDRRDRISQEAVDLARRSRDPAALAHALDGRLGAIVAPDTIAELVALADELCAVAELGGQPERVIAGHYFHFIARLKLCDISGAEAELAEATRIAEELHQPAWIWQVVSGEALLALARGRFDEAEEIVNKELTLGERATAVLAVPAVQMHRYALLTEQGRLEELERLEPFVRATVAEYPTRPFIRCVLIHMHTVLDHDDEARRAFSDIAKDGFASFPFDIEWLYGLSLLAETCALAGDNDSAAALYGLLSPYAALNAVNVPEGFRGSVSRYLGLLAATLERWDDAAQHFKNALERNLRMGARPWLAHTQYDYARMLNQRGETKQASELVAAAIATYRELGMQSHAAKGSTLAQQISTTTPSAQSAKSG